MFIITCFAMRTLKAKRDQSVLSCCGGCFMLINSLLSSPDYDIYKIQYTVSTNLASHIVL